MINQCDKILDEDVCQLCDDKIASFDFSECVVDCTNFEFDIRLNNSFLHCLEVVDVAIDISYKIKTDDAMDVGSFNLLCKNSYFKVTNAVIMDTRAHININFDLENVKFNK